MKRIITTTTELSGLTKATASIPLPPPSPPVTSTTTAPLESLPSSSYVGSSFSSSMVLREYPKVNLASQTLSSAPKSKSQFSWCTCQHPRRPGSTILWWCSRQWQMLLLIMMMMKMVMVKMRKTHKYERSAELTTTGRKGGAIAVVEVRVPEKQTIRFHKTLQWNKT